MNQPTSTTIPESAAPPPLSPGGRTAVRVLLVVVACALVAGVVLALAGFAWGASRFRVVADSITLPTTLRTLAVDTGPMPVAIRITSDREATEPRVDMRMLSPTRTGSDPLSLSADGLTARVSVASDPAPMLSWGRAGEITVVLPPQVARGLAVTTEQEMGVVVAEADLDQLIARNTDGAVVLNGSARAVDVTSAHGDITTGDAIRVADSFRAVTKTGDIAVNFAATPRTVEAQTQEGDVVIDLPGPGPFAVDATTGAGRGSTVVDVPQTRDRNDAVSVITARSERGDVVVEATS